jgi:hypothetical protein
LTASSSVMDVGFVMMSSLRKKWAGPVKSQPKKI